MKTTEDKVDKRDLDFFRFEKKFQELLKTHSNEDDEKLEKILSSLLIENVSMSITRRGRISTKFCGLKTKEHTLCDEEIYKLTIFFNGKYETSERFITERNFPTFFEWYNGQVQSYKEEIEKIQSSIDFTKGIVDYNKVSTTPYKKEQTTPKNINNVVFSFGGNDFNFEGMTGMKFVFSGSDDNGIRFEVRENDTIR